jgi:hypothetical protein
VLSQHLELVADLAGVLAGVALMLSNLMLDDEETSYRQILCWLVPSVTVTTQ